MEPITEDLSLRKQNMFFVEKESEKNSDWKGCSDWLADNNLSQWIVETYDITIPWSVRMDLNEMERLTTRLRVACMVTHCVCQNAPLSPYQNHR